MTLGRHASSSARVAPGSVHTRWFTAIGKVVTTVARHKRVGFIQGRRVGKRQGYTRRKRRVEVMMMREGMVEDDEVSSSTRTLYLTLSERWRRSSNCWRVLLSFVYEKWVSAKEERHLRHYRTTTPRQGVTQHTTINNEMTQKVRNTPTHSHFIHTCLAPTALAEISVG